MSEDPLSSPIYTINDDILLYIFTFNADMFSDDNALPTTRMTSQVCRHWRDLMLESPSLWAKLIDLDHMSISRTREWLEELFQRSGDAPLWIRAKSATTCTTPRVRRALYSRPFFRDLISKNWHRIQKLIFSTHSGFWFPRSTMCLPAPQLEHCEASVHSQQGVAPISNSNPLFANHAPMLRSIYLKCLLVNRQAPWLGHLHSIVLDESYNVPNALAILSAAGSLQRLKIKNNIYDYPDVTASTFPIASLPHLKSLEYNGGNVPVIAELLDHIEIPVNCSLCIQITGCYDTTLANFRIPSIINIFTRHAECALQTHIFDDIVFNYQRKSCISFACRATRPVPCSLRISLPLFDDADSNVLEIFSKRLIQLDLTSVKTLTFTADHQFPPWFGEFFSGLQSVETMHTDLQTLSHMARLQTKYASNTPKKPSILFPALKVIDIDDDRRSSQSTLSDNHAITALLLSRLHEGHPVATFGMPTHLPLHASTNLDALSELKGPAVLHNLSAMEDIVEYTGGSGAVEKAIDTV
ncbi:hypothetical protein HYPSUDRAFT_200349 [Hypholoma sublateritium FD-334 SS-4]|uniref:Uncharacterized protein n=1 Tax=Hypholoma sublateritium (strain FD-334 SS-4) TaxID=945553 RepID=A0A0D2PZN3_HYPSF|nr:hypothetical protein HYPSUDRAFT_200349 [Hypholoma sublateritium FD-334 SS-4]